jgi:hypothetical protein
VLIVLILLGLCGFFLRLEVSLLDDRERARFGGRVLILRTDTPVGAQRLVSLVE